MKRADGLKYRQPFFDQKQEDQDYEKYGSYAADQDQLLNDEFFDFSHDLLSIYRDEVRLQNDVLAFFGKHKVHEFLYQPFGLTVRIDE